MQELDAFEKYLQEKLKGQTAPQELMWKRLNDVISKPKVWYAKSIYKYALTAITAAGIGAGSTFLFMNQKKDNSIVEHSVSSIRQQAIEQKASNPTTLNNALILKDSKQLKAATHPLQDTEASSEKKQPFNQSETNSIKETLIYGNENSFNEFIQTTALINGELLASSAVWEEHTLQALSLKPIHISKQNLKTGLASKNTPSRFSMQIAGRKASNKLQAPAYVLNNSASYKQHISAQQKPTIQLQYHFPKGWFAGLGIGQQQFSLIENFNKTNVYSFDNKENYLFTYAFGLRQISDEELENGPWPNFPPNPPFGSDTSHVHTNYISEVQLNQIEFPINFGFEKSIGNFGIQFSAGLTCNYITNADQILSIPGYIPSQVNITQGLNRWNLNQEQSVKFEYFANSHLGVFLAPSYIFQWKGFASSAAQGFKVNQWHLNTGISWKF
jgi:hypothetical protein